MLQRNVTEEARVRSRTEYKSLNRKVKELVKKKSKKRRVDDEFGRRRSEKVNENKMSFWKEV